MTYGTTNKKVADKKWRFQRGTIGGNAGAQNFALVEKMFYLSKSIADEVENIRAEQGYYQSGHKEGGGSSNHAFISDPTSQLAIKRSEPIKSIIINSGKMQEDTIRWPEKWLYIIETTLNQFPETTLVGKVLRARYLYNEPQPTTCIDLDIDPSCYYKYYNARTEGIQFAKEVAIQLGLIKVI